jgi:hypothetical protein
MTTLPILQSETPETLMPDFSPVDLPPLDLPPLDLFWVHVMLFAFMLTIVPPNVLIMKAFTFIKMAFTFIKKHWLATILIALAVSVLYFFGALYLWKAHFEEASFATYQDAFPPDMAACALKQYHFGNDSPDPVLRDFWKTDDAPTCHIPDMMPLDRVPKMVVNFFDYWTVGPEDPVVSFETFHAYHLHEKLPKMMEYLLNLVVMVNMGVFAVGFLICMCLDDAARRAEEEREDAVAERERQRRMWRNKRAFRGLRRWAREGKQDMYAFIVHEAINVDFQGITAFKCLNDFAKFDLTVKALCTMLTFMKVTPVQKGEEEFRRTLIFFTLFKGMKYNPKWVANLVKDVTIIWAAKSRAASNVTTLALRTENFETRSYLYTDQE